MTTYTWAPPSGSDDLWSTATNWVIGTVTAGTAPRAGDTVIVSGAIAGPGTAAVMNLISADPTGAFQAGTVAVTGITEFGSGGASASLSAGTVIVGTATTDLDGAWLIFSASSSASVTGTIASEIDLGVGQIGNGSAGVNPDPATGAEVLELETGNAPADHLEVDGSQVSVNNGDSIYVGRANQSAGYILIANGGVLDVGSNITSLGYGAQSLGLLEIDSGATFVSEGLTFLGEGLGSLGELALGDPSSPGDAGGFFVQNGGELDLGGAGTGVVGGVNPTSLDLFDGASLELGLGDGGAGHVDAGVPLLVASNIDLGVADGGYGQIGASDGGNLLTVGGDVNVGVAGRGFLFNATGSIGVGISSSVFDVGVQQSGTGEVSLGGLSNSYEDLAVDGRLVVGNAGTGQVSVEYDDDLIVTNQDGTNVSEIGAQASGMGLVFISGATLDLSRESLIVGDAGQGTLVVNGTLTSALVGIDNEGVLLVGNQAGSSGTVIAQDGGLLASWSVVLGADAALEDDDGNVTTPAAFGSGVVSGPDTHWLVSTALTVGSGGTGSVNVSGGGTLTVGDTSDPATNAAERELTVGDSGFVEVQYGGTLVVNGAANIYGVLEAGLVDASGAPSVYFNNDGTSPLSRIHGVMTLSDPGTIFDADTQGIAIDPGTLTVENSAIASIGMLSGDALLIGNDPDEAGTLEILSSGTLESWAATSGVPQDAQGTVLVDDGSSNWFVATELDVGGAGTGIVTVSNGATVTAGDPADSGQFQGLVVGDKAGATGTVKVLSASSLQVNGALTIGNSGTGAVTIAAASSFTLDNFDGNYPTNDIGSAPGSSGTLVVTDADSTMDASTTSIYVGDQGDGTLVAENAANIDVGGTIGGGLVVGNQATGTGTLLVLNGGTLTSWQDSIGQNATAHGTVMVDGTGSLYMPRVGVTVGNSGTAALSITNGGAVVVGDPNDTGQNQQFILGPQTTGTGSVTVGSGSTLDVNGGMAIGNLGTGVATIAGGSTFTLDNFDGNYPVSSIGSGAASSGTLVVTDANTTMDASTLNLVVGGQGNGVFEVANSAYADVGSAIYASMLVGDGGSGTLAVLGGGTLALAQGVTIGNASGASGSLVVSDGGSMLDDSTGLMIIGNGGTGIATIGNGAVAIVGTSIAGDLLLGGNSGGKGNLTIANGGTLISDHAEVGGGLSATGTVTVTGTGALWTDNSYMFVGAFGGGTLAVRNGGSVTVGTNATVADVAPGSGKLTVDGSGAWFSVVGTLRLGSGKGMIGVTNGGVVTAGTLAIARGDTVSVDASSMLEVGSSFVAAVGGMVVESGAIAEGAGTILAAVRDDGTIAATGGTLELAGRIIGGGTLDDSGTLRLDGTVDPSLSLVFDPGTLFVGSPLAMHAIISNFGTADTIEFIGSYSTLSGDFSGGTLDVFGDGTLGGQFDFGPGYDDSNVFAKQAGGLVTITTDVACFAAGTRIATPGGEVAVEALTVGDDVLTLSGARHQVIWIGHRNVDCARHPKPRRVWPVRVAAAAFGRGRPHTDLFLSPDHAVYVNEVLIPVRCLVNGSTIVQVPVDRVTYYHIQLPQHDVVLAEGLPAESFLDMRDGSNYANRPGPVRLYPDYSARIWEAFGCARLVVTGPELETVRALVGRCAAEQAAA